MLTISLTIGHNVKGLPHWTTEQVANTVRNALQLEAFTAIPCVGCWNCEREDSTRVEIAHVDNVEASRIRSLVPLLCTLLLQDAIMYDEHACSVQFIAAQPLAA